MREHEWVMVHIALIGNFMPYDKAMMYAKCDAQAARRRANQKWELIDPETERNCEEEQRMGKIRQVHKI